MIEMIQFTYTSAFCIKYFLSTLTAKMRCFLSRFAALTGVELKPDHSRIPCHTSQEHQLRDKATKCEKYD
jgi:hypothetical protein